MRLRIRQRRRRVAIATSVHVTIGNSSSSSSSSRNCSRSCNAGRSMSAETHQWTTLVELLNINLHPTAQNRYFYQLVQVYSRIIDNAIQRNKQQDADEVHCVSKKRHPFYVCHNLVRCHPIHAILGRNIPHEICNKQLHSPSHLVSYVRTVPCKIYQRFLWHTVGLQRQI